MKKTKFFNILVAILGVIFLIVTNITHSLGLTQEEILNSNMNLGEMMKALNSIGINASPQQVIQKVRQNKSAAPVNSSTPASNPSTPANNQSTPASNPSTPANNQSTPASNPSTPASNQTTSAVAGGQPSQGNVNGIAQPKVQIDESYLNFRGLSAEEIYAERLRRGEIKQGDVMEVKMRNGQKYQISSDNITLSEQDMVQRYGGPEKAAIELKKLGFDNTTVQLSNGNTLEINTTLETKELAWTVPGGVDTYEDLDCQGYTDEQIAEIVAQNPEKYGATVTEEIGEDGTIYKTISMYSDKGPATLTTSRKVSDKAEGLVINLTQNRPAEYYRKNGASENMAAVASGMTGYGGDWVNMTEEEAAAYIEQVENMYKEMGINVEVSFIGEPRAKHCNNPDGDSLMAAIAIRAVDTNTNLDITNGDPTIIKSLNVSTNIIPGETPPGDKESPTPTPPVPTPTPSVPTPTPSPTITLPPLPIPEWKNNVSHETDIRYEEKEEIADTEHVTAILSPDRTNYTGKDQLYTLGDQITLTGTTCVHTVNKIKECTSSKIIHTSTSWLEYPSGYTANETTNSWEEEVPSDVGKRESLGTKKDSHKVYIKLNGFMVNDKSEFECLEDEEISMDASKPEWSINGQITKVCGEYDKKGIQKGTIKVYCNCGENGVECCNKTFELLFEKRTEDKPVDLTVESRPRVGGNFKISGAEWSSSEKTFEYKDRGSNNYAEIKAKGNSEYSIIPEANPGYAYKRIVNRDGNVVAETNSSGIANYIMPNIATKLYVNFGGEDTVNGHKVTYVVDTSSDGKIHGTVLGENPLTNVATGADVPLKEKVKTETGYDVSKWYIKDEHGNTITPDTDGENYFVMPDYDVVVHIRIEQTQYVNLTIKMLPSEYAGIVALNNSAVAINKEIRVKKGKIDLKSTAMTGYIFVDWEYEDGKIISKSDSMNYTISKDITIVARFKEAKKYTLYVKSTFGGTAWANYDWKCYEQIDILEGTEVDIQYQRNSGYNFDGWTYSPYTKPEKEEGTHTKIIMPAHNLTVTACFIKDGKSPKLLVTSNNTEWGSAWTKDDKGKKTDMYTWNSNVTFGKEYELNYSAANGYYFVKWEYSSKNSPFKGINMIKMPNESLVVMAVFAPIPVTGPYKVTFTADPPQGGSVPKDLTSVYSGSKVAIGVTPNIGWEFDYWYFVDDHGNVKENIEVYYGPDGTGYFIMPDYNVKAVAHFKPRGTYNLYVTHTAGGTAWTFDVVNNPTVQTTNVQKAVPDILYKIEYKVDAGYEFAGWEYRWSDYPNSKIDRKIDGTDYVIMPHSDLTVTAKFKKINQTGNYKLRVTSNNYLWGNAWVKVDGKTYSWKDGSNPIASSGDGIILQPNKDYEVYFKEENGYEFTNWGWMPDNGDYFTVRYDKANTAQYTGYGKINIPASKLKSDVELMAYFKPGNLIPEAYNLTVIVEPTEAGKVSGGGKHNGGTEYTVSVDVKDGYEFKFWYYTTDDGKIVRIYDEEFTGIMPNHDLTITAACEKIEEPGSTPHSGPTPPSEQYDIRVVIVGEGNVKDIGGNEVTVKRMNDGESILLKAIPKEGSNFAGWWINGKLYSTSLTETFTINGQDLVVYAYFNKGTKESNNDTLKIISVRDLNWKNYFVNASGTLTGNYFGVPQSGTMLKSVGKYLEVIKMGYAVEFELTTSHVDPDKAVLVITPELYDKNGKVSWDDVKDYMASTKGEKIDNIFKKIVIYGNNRDTTYKTKYQTSAKVDDSIKNNGLSINQITWNWIYYLPADIGYTGYKTSGDELTVRFKIQVHELNSAGNYVEPTSSSNGTLKEDIVVFEQNYSGVKWNGDVYKYSKIHSLLEDIYNNATN